MSQKSGLTSYGLVVLGLLRLEDCSLNPVAYTLHSRRHFVTDGLSLPLTSQGIRVSACCLDG